MGYVMMYCLLVTEIGSFIIMLINVYFHASRVDVLFTFSDNQKLQIDSAIQIDFSQVSELLNDENCMNCNENRSFRAKTAMISVITE